MVDAALNALAEGAAAATSPECAGRGDGGASGRDPAESAETVGVPSEQIAGRDRPLRTSC